MGCPSSCILGQNLTFTKQFYTGDGSAVDATGDVSYSVYENETTTAILTGTMAKFASQTGLYAETIACTAANGFEWAKSYTVHITATISGILVPVAYNFICLSGTESLSATTGALTTTANFKTYIGETSTDYDALITSLIARATSAIERYCDRVLVSATYRQRYDGDGTGILLLEQYPVTAVSLISTSTQDVLRITNTTTDAYHTRVDVSSTAMVLTIDGGTSEGSTSFTLADYTITTLNTAINATGSGWVSVVNDTTFGVWNASELLPVYGLHCLDNWVYVQTPYEPISSYNLEEDNGTVTYSGGFCQGVGNVIVKYTAGYVTTPADLEQICIDQVNIYFKGRDKDLGLKSEKLADHAITFADDARDISASMAKRLAPYRKWKVF